MANTHIHHHFAGRITVKEGWGDRGREIEVDVWQEDPDQANFVFTFTSLSQIEDLIHGLQAVVQDREVRGRQEVVT